MTAFTRPILAAVATLAATIATPALADDAGPITAVYDAASARYCIASLAPDASVATIAVARVGTCRTKRNWLRRGIRLHTPSPAQMREILAAQASARAVSAG